MTALSWIVIDCPADDPRPESFLAWASGEALNAAERSPECSAAWVLRGEEHEFSLGPPGAKASLVLQVRDAALKINRLGGVIDAEELPEQARVTHRTLLSRLDATRDEGKYWTMVRLDFVATEADAVSQEQQFRDWYTYSHVPQICEREGIHGGWWLSLEADAPRSLEMYWAVYEVDDPTSLGSSNKNVRFGEPWTKNIRDQPWGRSYHEIMYRYSAL